MKSDHLHIISFDIPYPANYGGVIDVFYKLKALKENGIKVTLHCFQYGNRAASNELKNLCKKVYYYPRKASFASHLSLKPYIVKSRSAKELINNLLKDNDPILFEGLHTSDLLSHPNLKDRFKIYRESNIEHHYYYSLAKSSRSLFKKAFYLIESLKLLAFQAKLKHADLMLTVSRVDQQYLSLRFPTLDVKYLPSFHENDEVQGEVGQGDYALFHGNLSVEENERSAIYLIKEIFSELDYPLVIAGGNPSKHLHQLADKHKHIKIIANPNDDQMQSLLKEAQVNIMITFQATGLKLKLLNALYQGRYCICNSNMLSGTSLSAICAIADTKEELIEKINILKERKFGPKCQKHRGTFLKQHYNNANQAQKLIKLLAGR